ncbi:MAG: hypothetical protein K0R47_2666 [Brevibacillus sp.]|nr:hypothetical protein [Brevibacillus sp.]
MAGCFKNGNITENLTLVSLVFTINLLRYREGTHFVSTGKGTSIRMHEEFWYSLQLYLLTLVMTPFGLVVIPRGIDTLIQHAALALMFYGYLLLNPLLFSSYLRRLKKKDGLQRGTDRSKQKLWWRAACWTIFSHFILYEMIFVWLLRVNPQTLHPPIEVVGLSAIALFVLTGSTGLLAYKHSLYVKKSRPPSHSTVFRK